MRKKEYIRWAIYGECGLYVGQCLTRKDAIAEHVSMKFAGISRFASGGLDSSQAAAWSKCVKLGDRAVRVKITEAQS